ncbi:hypothetical protein EYF80_050777 [Liparis tanakae]|uniref:Uncharacterized protein n=1 Tax=Liparis tanakae TaxID=230148 RepID=A0A4Z2FDU2_9TELE|nr:hypothetical protein EYF80_050777 [Liparis tanakae]
MARGENGDGSISERGEVVLGAEKVKSTCRWPRGLVRRQNNPRLNRADRFFGTVESDGGSSQLEVERGHADSPRGRRSPNRTHQNTTRGQAT